MKGIKAIYDAGENEFDRYTVYFSDRKGWGEDRPGIYPYVAMSLDPFWPLGLCQYGSGRLGRHNGRKIKFEDLPKDCQKAVMRDL